MNILGSQQNKSIAKVLYPLKIKMFDFAVCFINLLSYFN